MSYHRDCTNSTNKQPAAHLIKPESIFRLIKGNEQFWLGVLFNTKIFWKKLFTQGGSEFSSVSVVTKPLAGKPENLSSNLNSVKISLIRNAQSGSATQPAFCTVITFGHVMLITHLHPLRSSELVEVTSTQTYVFLACTGTTLSSLLCWMTYISHKQISG